MCTSRSIPKQLLAVAAACAVCLAGCADPRNAPGLSDVVERRGEKLTKDAEEEIKKSPALQELDRLCTKVILISGQFKLVAKKPPLENKIVLEYGYHSEQDPESVKRLYTEYFSQQGWRLAAQEEGVWGPSYVEFTNEGYRVKVYYEGLGNEGDYLISCEKLPAPAESK